MQGRGEDPEGGSNWSLLGKYSEFEFEECLLRLILEESNARQRRRS